MLNSMVLDLKLFFHNRSVKIALVLILFSFFLMTKTFVKEAEEMSRLPIGMIDEDHSDYSKRLRQSLNHSKTIKVYEDSYEALEHMLKKGTIMALFQIPSGYGEKVSKGAADDLLKMKFVKGNDVSKILADVIVGEFLYDLCMSRSYLMYENLEYDKKWSRKEYTAYIDRMKEDAIFEFGFVIDVIKDFDENKESVMVDSSLLYHQITIVILSIAFSFLFLFVVEGITVERGSCLWKRIQLCSGQKRLWFGHLIFLSGFLLLCSSFGALFLLYVQLISTWYQAVLCGTALFVYGGSIIFLLLLLKWFVHYSSVYQIIGSFLILLCGGIGVFGVILKNLLFILKFTPNYWLIQTITDILLLETIW